MPVSRLRPALLVAVLLALAACSSDGLHQRATVTATRTAVVNASYTAALDGPTAHVMLPSGRLDLTTTAPLTRLDARQVARAAPLRAASGTELVGVRWLLERSVYPHDVVAGAPTPAAVFGPPRTVRLWVVAGGVRREITGVDNLVTRAGRPNTAVWVAVPAGARSLHLEVGYGDATQVVDARTGRLLDAGPAAALYHPLPAAGEGTCRVAGLGRDSCGAFPVVGYPYVDGGGWAPTGHTWAVLQVQLRQTPDNYAGEISVEGTRDAATVDTNIAQFSAFVVDTGRASWPLSGSVLIGRRHAALTGSITRAGS